MHHTDLCKNMSVQKPQFKIMNLKSQLGLLKFQCNKDRAVLQYYIYLCVININNKINDYYYRIL